MVVFLTGANGGIGSAISSLLKSKNIKVVEPSSSELNLTGDLNVGNEPINGFIHCAGINILANHSNITQENLYKIFEVNTFSFLKLCSKLNLINGSNVIGIGSLYSTLTKENRIQYAMSKHAMYGAVKTLALEMAENDIKVNLISPGFVDTKLTRKNNTKERIEFLENNIPLGLTTAEEIAKICLYFITENKFITGQNIIVDGGYSLRNL